MKTEFRLAPNDIGEMHLQFRYIDYKPKKRSLWNTLNFLAQREYEISNISDWTTVKITHNAKEQ